MADETRKLIRDGAAELLKEGTGFEKIRRGIVRAQADGDIPTETLLGEMEQKDALMRALLDLFGRRKILRRQIAYVLRLLVEGNTQWAELWQKADVDPAAVKEVGVPQEQSPQDEATAEPDDSGVQRVQQEATQAPGSQLRMAFAELEAMNFDSAARRAPLAFRYLTRGVTEEGADALLDAFSQKEETINFLLDLHGAKKLYRKKVACCLATVLRRPSWAQVAGKSSELQQRVADHLQLQECAERGGDAELKDAGKKMRTAVSAYVMSDQWKAMKAEDAECGGTATAGDISQPSGGYAKSAESPVKTGDLAQAKEPSDASPPDDSDSDADPVETPEAVAERNNSEARAVALATIEALARPKLEGLLVEAELDGSSLEQLLEDYLDRWSHEAKRKIGLKGLSTWSSISEKKGLSLLAPKPFVRLRAYMHRI